MVHVYGTVASPDFDVALTVGLDDTPSPPVLTVGEQLLAQAGIECGTYVTAESSMNRRGDSSRRCEVVGVEGAAAGRQRSA